MGCLKDEGEGSAFQRLLDKVQDGSLDVQVALCLMRLYQESMPAEKVSQLQPEGRRAFGHLGDPAFRVLARDVYRWWLSCRLLCYPRSCMLNMNRPPVSLHFSSI